MGQSFFLSLYKEKEHRYLNRHFFFCKLGEIAQNECYYWGYIKDRPLNIAFIGSESDYYRKDWNDSTEPLNYGVASKETLFQNDCVGKLEFEDDLPPFEWSGYLVNHTQGLYIDVSAYYERSRIGTYCLDPLAILTASGPCASLFWEGFTNGTAYSLLSSWFADVVEWVDNKPTGINELATLEFCELPLFSMYDEWGLTSESYLADRNGKTLYSRKDIGVIFTRISPVSCKYKFKKTADGQSLVQEIEPDAGVVIVPDGSYISFANSDGEEFKDFKKEWYGNANIRNTDGSVHYLQNLI